MYESYRDDTSPEEADVRPSVPASVLRLGSAALFVGLVTGMGLWAYELGTRDAREVPVIRAMVGPARVVPDDPGGLRAAHQGHELNDLMAGMSAPLPRSAQALPVPAALAEEDGPQGALQEAVATVPEDVEAVVAPQDVPPEDEPEADTARTGPPPVYDEGPAPRRRPRAMNEAARLTAPVEPKEVARVPEGARLLQLGAFDSEDVTRATWADLVAQHTDLLGAKSLYVQRATSNARVFYRLRVAGFETADETRAMCEALKARSVSCIPTTVQY